MRYLVMLFAMVASSLFLASCKPKPKSIDDNIKVYVDANFNDPKSWEPVKTIFNNEVPAEMFPGQQADKMYIHDCKMSTPTGGKVFKKYAVLTNKNDSVLYMVEL
jgi:hypothetical protein